MRLSTSEAISIAEQAAKSAGASGPVAASLAQAVVAAEWSGNRAVGFAHLMDYLDGFRCGRIAGDAKPSISFPAAATVRVDANRGIAQLGFDLAFDELLARAKQSGVAVFSQFNSFTVGELGYYTRRLADAGMVAIAACNATAQVTTVESGKPVFGTNPMSFAAPTNRGKSFVIDQASSAAAFVRVRQAAAAGESIPEGWAVNAQGEPTTSALEALTGLLLPFGGPRGAHIAMMVEFLGAGLTGGNWSMDAPPYAHGAESPAVGLFINVIDPEVLVPGFTERLSTQIDRLADMGVRIPGSHINITELDVPDDVLASVRG